MKTDEFYIGYLGRMQSATARAVTVAVTVAMLCASIVLGLGLASQSAFDESFFDFGNVRGFRGTLRAGAVPFLIVESPADPGSFPVFRRYALVAEGKHGFDASGFDGRTVSLRGTLIRRGGIEMIEVASDPVTVEDAPTAVEGLPEKLGRFKLLGEIVDSKCYLGVMNPGRSKPHRDCAVACIRGGIPPLFYVADAAGNVAELWLTGPDGEPIGPELLDHVAEPVWIEGDLERVGDQLFFRIEPAEIRR
jgi:hypothetical protein